MQKRNAFADLAVSNVAATFRQCLSLIRKQAIDTGLKTKFRQDILAKHAKNLTRICWFQALYVGGWGLATIG